MSASLSLRPATADDLSAITAVYAHAVRHDTGTFELDPPSPPEMGRRMAEVAARGLPWLVAARGSQVLGYAYAGAFRPRPAYRYTVENSVYLAADARGQGLGRLLLAELLARCEALGLRQMVAVIGDSDNAASIALHRRLGFMPAGQLRCVGHKFGRWLDVVMMQRPLGLGDSTQPDAPA